jgi:hypothetical protein
VGLDKEFKILAASKPKLIEAIIPNMVPITFALSCLPISLLF